MIDDLIIRVSDDGNVKILKKYDEDTGEYFVVFRGTENRGQFKHINDAIREFGRLTR